MASLNDSKTFQTLNKSSSITSKIAKLVATGVLLDRSYIEEQYIQIQKTRISPISEKILTAFDEKRIRLIWNKQLHLTIAIPFVVLMIEGKPTGCIFISDFSSMNKDATALTIDMKKLYEDRLEIKEHDMKTAAIKRDWKAYGNLKDEKKEILLKLKGFKK